MTYDTLRALAPTAPRDLLERLAGVLDEKPGPDVLLLISEALFESAHEAEMDRAAYVNDLRELAKAIAPGVMLNSCA